MFTGLITEVGRIIGIEKSATSAIFKIDAPGLIAEIKQGDSVAVNGVCLTATSISGTSFSADVMVQTLSLTSLSQLEIASPVNLELAAQLDTRMGGHMVQGHVDAIAKVVAIRPGDQWIEFEISVPDSISKYIVNQGSICLDGVSLTVGQVVDATHSVIVWLIPQTLAHTNFSTKLVGDLINVEVDVIAKYVERLLAKGTS